MREVLVADDQRLIVAMEIANFVVPHQATGHRWVALNNQQYRAFMRRDKIGGVWLPSYVDRWIK